MSFVVVIPARLAASRLPGKPLRLLAGRPLIAHVVDAAKASGASEIVVATDSEAIAAVIDTPGVRVAMTRADHPSGTDRIAEVAQTAGWSDERVVVNLQGDEPLVPPEAPGTVAALLEADRAAAVSTLAHPIDDVKTLFDPNVVKVVRDARGRALYFSRAPIPWARAAFGSGVPATLPVGIPWLRHIGLYGYRVGFLRRYASLSPSVLEQAEALEQLRVLAAGESIAVGLAAHAFPPGVDTAEDLARVEQLLAQRRENQS